MVDVVIVTPGPNVANGYVSSLVGTLIGLTERGLSYNWVNGSSSLVHHAREIAVSAGTLDANETAPFGGRDYGQMLWIDSDISWHPEDALRLLDSPYEVTSGAYLLADGVTTSVHAWGTPGGMPVADVLALTEPTKMQSIGFGFVAIKRGVFERMARPWFAHLSQPVMRDDGTAIMDSLGEDISWCVRAYQAGVDIYLDPEVLVTHHKTVPIGWPPRG